MEGEKEREIARLGKKLGSEMVTRTCRESWWECSNVDLCRLTRQNSDPPFLKAVEEMLLISFVLFGLWGFSNKSERSKRKNILIRSSYLKKQQKVVQTFAV